MLRAILLLVGILFTTVALATVEPPRALVIVSCKGEISGPPDQNGVSPHDWVTKDAMLICRREIAELTDAAELKGAIPLNSDFSDTSQCARIAMGFAPQYQAEHPGWFVLVVGCPVPIINKEPDGKETIIGYQMPGCPSWVKCEEDSAI